MAVENRIALTIHSLTSGNIPRRIESKVLERVLFIAELFLIATRWKQPNCPLIDEWINKTSYICIMGYYSAF